MRVRPRGKRTRVRSVEEQTEYASTEGARTTRVSFNLRLPSARERKVGEGETGGAEEEEGEFGGARGKEREERGGEEWRQGEIEELLSDQRRTEKLFPAFELLHTRVFPSDGKAAPKWKSHEFLPPTATSRVCAPYMVLSYARLRIRGFLRSPRFRSEVNFYRVYLFQWGRMIRFLV